MTDQTAAEPTMEEILASIRRIISEDDAPVETAAADEPEAAAAEPEPQAEVTPEPVVASEPEPESEPEPAPAEDDVLELTDRYEAPAAESIGDLDVSEPEPAQPVSQTSAPLPAATPSYDSLVGDSAAASAASAFAGLASSFRKPEAVEASGNPGPTIEDITRALLRPMLKEWLDANLPTIVEAQVRKEVERIARG